MIVIVSSYRASPTETSIDTTPSACPHRSPLRRDDTEEDPYLPCGLDREPAAPEHEIEVAFARHSATMRLMIRIDFEYGTLSVDAALIAEGLQIDAKLRAQDARGKITSVCERGVDRDAG